MLRSRKVSHNYHHEHGAYILDNADAPGFAVLEMHHLSLLMLGHPGRLEAGFEDQPFVHQLLCRRLAGHQVKPDARLNCLGATRFTLTER
ncbi:MAG: hypothetical protein Q7T21_14580 [Gallionella sp.]|nr:hypothetical protein [Gallionella sp.]